MKVRRKFPARALLGAVAILALLATACSSGDDQSATDTSAPSGGDSDWAQVVAAAEQEGKLVLYDTRPGEAIERTIAGFNEVYPDIDVEFIKGVSGEMVARMDQERATGAAGGDVFVAGELGWFLDQAEAGRLLPADGPAAAGWPSQYMIGDGTIPLGSLEVFVMAYNKNLVNREIKSYDDMLDPAFKGNMGTTEPASTTLAAWYGWLQETEGPDYLPALAAQEPSLYNGSVALTQAVAAGEHAVTPFTVLPTVKPLIDQGAPIDYVVPNPAFGFTIGSAALGWAKNPNAARVFVDYMMTPAGQEAWHGSGVSASPLPNIPGSLKIEQFDPYDPADYPPEVVSRIQAEFTALFVG